MANSTECSLAFVRAVQFYFPGKFNHPSPKKFDKLATLLSENEVDAYAFMMQTFSIWPTDKTPTINQLTNLELILNFKHQISRP